MTAFRLAQLCQIGQSVWLDSLRRSMLTSGELADLIETWGVTGVTSNPSVFEKVVAGSHDYQDAIRRLAGQGLPVEDVYRTLAVEDVQRACDLLLPVYRSSEGRDGFASLDIAPQVSHDTEGILESARSLWQQIDRPNAMIKIPATSEALLAIERLTREGISLHAMRLFDIKRYQRAAESYLTGIEARLKQGQPVADVHFAAGFLVGRIDLLVDALLDRLARRHRDKAASVAALRGRVGLAVSALAYAAYQEIVAAPRFQRLAAHGVRPPRLMWSSTDVKHPAYDELLYIDGLAAPQTIIATSAETMGAFAARGTAASRAIENTAEARATIDRLHELDLDFDQIAQQLRDESIDRFFHPFDRLSVALRSGLYSGSHRRLRPQQVFPGSHERRAVHDRLRQLRRQNFARRLWQKEPQLWQIPPAEAPRVGRAMNWLNLADKMEGYLPELVEFVDEVEGAGFRHVVHVGGPGSTRTVMLLREMLASGAVGLPFTVVHGDDLSGVEELQRKTPLAKVLFLIDEPPPHEPPVMPVVHRLWGMVNPSRGTTTGKQFVAIAQHDSELADLAVEQAFRRVFFDFRGLNEPFLALSYLGLVPAALMGVDLEEFLARSQLMVHGCASSVPLRDNDALVLGATLGELALKGRNKLTFLLPERLTPLGWWLEDLLAGSVDWLGRGLVPVVGGQPRPPALYRRDRVFVGIHLAQEPDAEQEQLIRALRQAGHPVISIPIADALDLGQEFFRWQMAAVTAAAVLGINPFPPIAGAANISDDSEG